MDGSRIHNFAIRAIFRTKAFRSFAPAGFARAPSSTATQIIMFIHWIGRCIHAAPLMVIAATMFAGCADMDRRFREGARWIAEAEKERRDLEKQGFPQYSPPL